MTRLLALAALLTLAWLLTRRRPEAVATWPEWQEDWDDPAMDVYNAVQPADPRTVTLAGWYDWRDGASAERIEAYRLAGVRPGVTWRSDNLEPFGRTRAR